MTISQFDRTNGKAFHEAAKHALRDLADEYGVVIEMGNWTYTGASLSMQVHAKIIDVATGKAKHPPTLVMMARQYDLDLDRVSQGHRLVDYHSSKPKFPWITEDANGKRWKHVTSGIMSRFKRIIPEVAKSQAPIAESDLADILRETAPPASISQYDSQF